MRSIVTYQDADAFLTDLIRSGIKLGLENTHRLLAAVDNPHLGQHYVHVAGTNGKGSVSAMVAAALTGAGRRTGLNTSPHLVNVRERFRVDGEAISEALFTELVRELATRAAPMFDTTKNVQTPTYFEFLTVLGFLFFRRMNCDIAVIEVGMGGRLDSTNVIDPDVCVITTIDFDHMNALGDTLALIAGEKAGIIKHGVPVICGEPRPEPLTIIAAVAAERRAPLHLIGRDFVPVRCVLHADDNGPLQTNTVSAGGVTRDLVTRLAGRHQLDNAAVAHAVLVELTRLDPTLDLNAAVAALSQLVWPGRLQTMPDGVIIDASHNHAGMTSLLATFREIWPERRFTVLFGALNAKPWREMLTMLVPVATTIHIVGIPHTRAGDPVEQHAWLRDNFPAVCGDLVDSPAAGLARVRAVPNGLIAGSLYLVGAVLHEYTDGEPVPVYVEAFAL